VTFRSRPAEYADDDEREPSNQLLLAAVVIRRGAAAIRRRRSARRPGRRDQGSTVNRDTPSSQADWGAENVPMPRQQRHARAPVVRRLLVVQSPIAPWCGHNCPRPAAEPEGLGVEEDAAIQSAQMVTGRIRLQLLSQVTSAWFRDPRRRCHLLRAQSPTEPYASACQPPRHRSAGRLDESSMLNEPDLCGRRLTDERATSSFLRNEFTPTYQLHMNG
jgi:hypothetical protein